jgi:hypothetical protein
VVVVVEIAGVDTVLTTTRPTSTTLRVSTTDYSAFPATIGIAYEFSYEFSTIYRRKQDGSSDTRGRLQLSRAILHYRRSRAFDVEVTPEGRPTRTKPFTADAVQDGEFSFPIQTRNTTTTIVVTNDTPFPSVLTGLDWEGNLVNRSRRV